MSRSRGRLGRAKETRFSCGLPLMQCVLVKTASGATGNESESNPVVMPGPTPLSHNAEENE